MAELPSICVVANRNVCEDLLVMLRTFDLFNRSRAFIACDAETVRQVSALSLSQCEITCLRIIPDHLVSVRSHGPGFKELLMLKMDIMEIAVRECGATMLFDSDMVFLNEVFDIDLEHHEVVLNRMGLKETTRTQRCRFRRQETRGDSSGHPPRLDLTSCVCHVRTHPKHKSSVKKRGGTVPM